MEWDHQPYKVLEHRACNAQANTSLEHRACYVQPNKSHEHHECNSQPNTFINIMLNQINH